MIDPMTFEACGSGRWFPSDGMRLRGLLNRFIDEADALVEAPREIVGGIAPHAGLDISGPVAAYTFAALRKSCRQFGVPDFVSVLGFSHRESYPALALLNAEAFRTPMATSAIATDAVETLCGSCGHIVADSEPHFGEHSAENIIPFVQHVLPDCPLLVGLFGTHDDHVCGEIASAFRALMAGRHGLLLASTDLLHDPDYDRVTTTDSETLRQIAALDRAGLRERWHPHNQVCCGLAPVTTMLDALVGVEGIGGRILRYRNCGDDYPETRGEWVVGYGAVVFEC